MCRRSITSCLDEGRAAFEGPSRVRARTFRPCLLRSQLVSRASCRVMGDESSVSLRSNTGTWAIELLEA